MMVLSLPLAFQPKGQIYFLMHLYGKNIENFIFQELLKTDVSYLAQILYLPRIWKYINVQVIGMLLTFVSRSHEFYIFKQPALKPQGTL